MNARNITIVNSRTQSTKTISSSATTLGQLKSDLRNAGIDYNGLAFFEGISKTTLNDDASILPSNLSYRGKITNDLVFMLTEPQKKIRNGAGVATRSEAYNYIKANGFGAAVEKKFGQNFTRCKTDDLVSFCNSNSKKAAPAVATSTTKTKTAKVAKPAHKPTKPGKVAEAAVAAAPTAPAKPAAPAANGIIDHETLVNLLVSKGIISEHESKGGQPESLNLSSSEIKSMFAGVR